MGTYKAFTLNEAGDPPPWGATEVQAWKDLIDTVVEDAVDEEKKTTGHKHFKLYCQTNGNLAMTIIADGTAKYTGGDFAIQNNLGRFSVETYSTTLTDKSLIQLRKSASNTVGTVAATADGDVLGEIQFQGVDNVPAVDPAAAIRSTQVGATDTQIGADLSFWTAVKGGTLSEKMTLGSTSESVLSLGKKLIEDWDGGSRTALQLEDCAIFGYGVDFYYGANVYHDGAFKRVNNDEATLYRQINGNHIWYANEAAAPDVGFTPKDRMYLTARDFSEGSARLGIGTGSPFLNVGTASGDFTDADGIHIKSDIATTRKAMLIVEGDSTGNDAASIVLADNAQGNGLNIAELALVDGQLVSSSDLEIRTLTYQTSEHCVYARFEPWTNGILGKVKINPDKDSIDFIVYGETPNGITDINFMVDASANKVWINPDGDDVDFEFKKAISFDWGSQELVLNPDGGTKTSIGRDTFESWDMTLLDILQIGGNGAIFAHRAAGATKALWISQNAYFDDNDNRYEFMDTDEATLYQQGSGLHTFAAADSGTADTEISWLYILQLGHDGTNYTMEHNQLQDNINWEINSDGYSALLLDADGNSGSGALYSAMLNATKTGTPATNDAELHMDCDTGELYVYAPA